MSSPKILNTRIPSPELCFELSSNLGISPVIAQLLVNRGIRGLAEARAFLSPDAGAFHDPFSFAEMPLALNLIRKAGSAKQNVLLYGDYDVDGVTSLAVLTRSLARRGITAAHYIPHRVKEGYGLNAGIVALAKEKKIGLVITVDCGTNSGEIIKALRANGVEVIVTDHHEPSFSGDHPASALINPKIDGCGYPYRELAGVGVAFKLCQALTGETLEDELDIVALGTVADSVPLTGENRVIAAAGLRRIAATGRPGLRVLMESGGIDGREINGEHVSFILAPRLNASGRMDTAEKAFELLMCAGRDEAAALAKELEGYNRLRQKTEARMLEEAQALIDREVNFKDHKVIVVAKEGWHTGCLGIVASKIAGKFYRPVILISLDGEGRCRGSGRSIRNFHLFNGLHHCGSLLEGYGGHEHAVGMSILPENVREFRDRLNAFAAERLRIEDLIPSVEIDMDLGLGEITRELIGQIARLEPFGEGNPEPVFHTPGLKVKGQSRVMGRQALKFWVTDGSATLPVIGFGMGAMQESLHASKGIDLVYRPKIDSWQGMDSLILEAKEIILK